MVRALERQCKVGYGGRVARGHVGMEDLLRGELRRGYQRQVLPSVLECVLGSDGGVR